MKTLILSLVLSFSFLASATELTRGDQKKIKTQVRKIATRLEQNKLDEVRVRTFFTLDMILKTAVKELRKKGHDEKADEIESQWSQTYSPRVFRCDVGDFEPLSDWLSAVYISLELLLGEYIVKTLHLDDIHIINHALPVVFQPCKGPWLKDDYSEHFAALSGVIGYWSIFIGCTVGTSGIGLFFCVPAGVLGEFVLANFLAPGIGNGIFDLFCSRVAPMK